jgi:tetratricopeptide (TPR) repeat protein
MLTAATIASFGYKIGQSFLQSALIEWKKLKDNREAQARVIWLADIEQAKILSERIANKISAAFRAINLTEEEFNLLIPLASDPVLNTELSRLIISDTYTPESIVNLILENQTALKPHQNEIQKLADLLILAIQNAIAEDPQLHRVKELQYQANSTAMIADLGKEMSGGNANILEAIKEMSGKMDLFTRSSVLSASVESTSEVGQIKSINQKRFDDARHELINGSIVVAEKQYRALIRDLEGLGKNADLKLLFRSYTNLGSSLWMQFKRDEALEWFEKAFQTAPEEPKAKTNKALCHIHRREWEAALNILHQLRIEDPKSFEALYLISIVFSEQGELENAIAVLESQTFELSDYFVALSQSYSRNGEFSDAAESAKKALTIDGERPDALSALGNSLGFPIVNRRTRREPKAFSLTEDEWNQMQEAIKVCEHACDNFRKEERFFQLGELLTNLAAFYEVVGKTESAMLAAKEASELMPVHDKVTALGNLWASQMKCGKSDDAYNTANELMQCGQKTTGKLRQLEALLANSKHEDLLNECENEPALVPELEREPRFFEIKAQANFEEHRISRAFTIINDALIRFPEDSNLFLTRASFYEESGQPDLARNDLEQAERFVGKNELRTLFEIAMFWYGQKNWTSAAKWFIQLGADSIYSPFFNNYLICLFNTGKYPICSELATKALKVKSAFDEVLYGLAARCAYSSNELPTAEKLLEELVRHKSQNVLEHQKMLAQAYLRMDEPDKAFGLLKKVSARNPKDIDVLVGLTYSASLLKLYKEAIGYGIQAVKAFPTNERAHMIFVKVALECPDEFKIDENHRVVFQQSLAFLEKQPSGFIKSVPIEKDLKSFIAIAKARADHAHKVEDLVRERNLPMAFLAQQLGVSSFQTWSALIGHSNLHVFMAYGTTEEQTNDVKTALNANSICVDVFALMTLRLLKQLDLLPKLFQKIFIHVAGFETIVEDIRQFETNKAAFSISYHDGKLVRSEIAPEHIEQRLLFLKDIRDFIKSKTVELVGVDASVMSDEQTKIAKEFLGDLHYETILAAKVRGVAYYSDDAPMRSLAFTEHKISGFCTQAMLRAAKEKKLLNDLEYEDCVITLLKHNYYFVSESVETLARLTITQNFQISDVLRRMIYRVTDPKVNRDTSIRILSDFFLFLWREDYLKAEMSRDEWLEFCLAAILKAKDTEQLFPHFIANLAGRTLYHPETFGGISAWIFRCKKLSILQHQLFYIGVQQTILEMCKLAAHEAQWWPELKLKWLQLGRINIMLLRNGWL